jgi:hypothetical protein
MKLLPVARVSAMATLLLLASCATRPAPGISGRWTPVNRWPSAPEEIPLAHAYVFFASPVDRTLKTMLARWASDLKMTLDYRHPSDFSLYAPVGRLRTDNLQDAAANLTALYAREHVLVAVRDNAILVSQSGVVPATQDSMATTPPPP